MPHVTRYITISWVICKNTKIKIYLFIRCWGNMSLDRSIFIFPTENIQMILNVLLWWSFSDNVTDAIQICIRIVLGQLDLFIVLCRSIASKTNSIIIIIIMRHSWHSSVIVKYILQNWTNCKIHSFNGPFVRQYVTSKSAYTHMNNKKT